MAFFGDESTPQFARAATARGADVRVDEESLEAYNQIVDLLLAGKEKHLHPFKASFCL